MEKQLKEINKTLKQIAEALNVLACKQPYTINLTQTQNSGNMTEGNNNNTTIK